MYARGRGALATVVGRRTLLLFVCCALLPTSLLAVFAYSEVRTTLQQEATQGLAEVAKRRTSQIAERATWLAHMLRDGTPAPNNAANDDEDSGIPRFRSAVRVQPDGSVQVLVPDSRPPSSVALDAKTSAHVEAGGVAIVVEPAPIPRVWFVGRIPSDSLHGIVWAEPEPRFLWGFAHDEAVVPGVCVLHMQSRRVLQCSAEAPSHVALSTLGDAADEDWLTASRSLYLRHEFAAGDWRVVSMQSVTDALHPVRGFGRTFALVVGLSLLVVLFASQVQIRRQTEPLALLHAATQDMAAGKFDVSLRVDSRDEFAALAASFKGMSSTLGRQFDMLRALDEVDRKALDASSSLSLMRSAAQTLLTAASSDRLVLAAPQPDGPQAEWQVVELLRDSPDSPLIRLVDRPKLSSFPPAEGGHNGSDASAILRSLGLADSTAHWVLYPLWHNDQSQGVVALSFPHGRTPAMTERRELRQLTDRLAVALANTHLVQRLDALSIGTVTAFARVIDANSHWTAGHSERVTAVALQIGDALGISAAERDILHRGSLLHDIGKIGVPSAILDKAGPLTDQEMQIIRTHASLGATILQPLGAFHDIMPLVRSHHERIDGKGYPDGLRGEAIPYLVRILSVADVYDALVSKRPYRAGMSSEDARRMISADAGRAFDPRITAVFLALHESGFVSPYGSKDFQGEALAAAVGHGRQLLEEHV